MISERVNGKVTAERRNGRWRQAKQFGYDSEQNLCEVSEIIAASGEPLVCHLIAGILYNLAGLSCYFFNLDYVCCEKGRKPRRR